MITLDEFIINFTNIKLRIERACRESGRDISEVQLLPVTKTHPVQAIEYALHVGLTSVGENRIQEVKEKKPVSSGNSRWELIGHLQSNKVNDAVRLFDRIQSVDSLKLIRKLNTACEVSGKVLPIFLQCNAGEDPNKYGFSEASMAEALEAVLGSAYLKCEGLMTIAPLDDDPLSAKACFEKLRTIRDSLISEYGIELKELSMGMTQDLEEAIAAGSTMIRVGSALYGSRA
jgi:pyridoxal phosphate enzyme (YggS family)